MMRAFRPVARPFRDGLLDRKVNAFAWLDATVRRLLRPTHDPVAAFYSGVLLNGPRAEAILPIKRHAGRLVVHVSRFSEDFVQQRAVRLAESLAQSQSDVVVLTDVAYNAVKGPIEQVEAVAPKLRLEDLSRREVTLGDAQNAFLSELLDALATSWMGGSVVDLAERFLSIRPETVIAVDDLPGLAAAYACLFVGVPRVVLSLRERPPRHLEPYFHGLRGAFWVLSQSEHVTFVCPSERSRDEYLFWIGTPKAPFHAIQPIVLRAGEFVEGSRQSQESELFTASIPVVTGVFRGLPWERLDLWLKAAALISARRPDVCFRLCVARIAERHIRKRALAAELTAPLEIVPLGTATLDELAPVGGVLLSTSQLEVPSDDVVSAVVGERPTVLARPNRPLEGPTDGMTICEARPSPLSDGVRVRLATGDNHTPGAGQACRTHYGNGALEKFLTISGLDK